MPEKGDPMADTKSTSTPTESSEGFPGCPVAFCPVGMLMTLAGQARPEVVEHLMAAGRELVLAASAFMNARADEVGQKARLEKIQVD